MQGRLELHQATDELNEALKRAEQVLQEMDLGVEASVPFESSEDGKLRHLAFQKRGREFQLVFIVHHTDESAETQSVLAASRKTRVMSVDLLDKLKDALLLAYEEELKRVKTAIDKADEFTRKTRQKRDAQ